MSKHDNNYRELIIILLKAEDIIYRMVPPNIAKQTIEGVVNSCIDIIGGTLISGLCKRCLGTDCAGKINLEKKMLSVFKEISELHKLLDEIDTMHNAEDFREDLEHFKFKEE